MQPISQPNYGEYRWLASAIGEYLNWNPDWNAWDHEQENTCDDLIESACMMFYFPPPVELSTKSHQWSFLRPVKEFMTESGQFAYELPLDFERFDGPITYKLGSEDYPALQITSEQRIRQLQYRQTYTSYPVYAAYRPKASDGSQYQRMELLLHPTPDSNYTLEFAYVAVPKKLSDTYPVPLGGRVVAEALKAACLAEAELHKTGEYGPRQRVFRDKLATAIANDMLRNAELLGYNADTSVLDSNKLNKDIRRVRDFLFNNVTYDG